MLRGFILLLIAIIVCVKAGTTSKVSTPAVKTVKKEENGIKNFVTSVMDATKGQSVSASVKDTSVNGIEGLNVKWEVPFKVQDYIVGFKYSVGDLKKTPDSLFAKKKFSTSGDGTATIDADYSVDSKVFGVEAQWESDKLGLKLNAVGDTKDRLTEVGLASTQSVKDAKVTLAGVYDNLKKKLNLAAKASNDDISAQIKYNTKDQDPVLTLSKKLDSNNCVAPSISLKSGEVSYKWNRKFTGGELEADFHPGDNLVLEWTDQGANGEWVTKADIPVDNQAGTKVSFSRKWTY